MEEISTSTKAVSVLYERHGGALDREVGERVGASSVPARANAKIMSLCVIKCLGAAQGASFHFWMAERPQVLVSVRVFIPKTIQMKPST